ncbi:MAG: hypothetical protein HY815_30945 [Candidatus Riflebacteria bacterium]|nr:hypothetical protein [Candidatus Riflebacteria bacterium]
MTRPGSSPRSWLWSGLALLVLPTLVVAADLNFKMQTNLDSILSTIATLGRFNLVTCPGVDRVKTTFCLVGVDPVEALYIAARANGFHVKKLDIRNAGGNAPDTFVVGTKEQIEKSFESMFTRLFRFKHCRVTDLVEKLSSHFEALGVMRVKVDDRTNSLVMHGTGEALARLAALFDELDLPAAEVVALLTLEAGPASKPQPVWQTEVLLASGQETTIELNQGVPAKGDAARSGLTLIGGTLSVMVNGDGHCQARTSLKGVWEDQTGPVTLKFQGQGQLANREEKVLQTIRPTGDRVITLKLKVDVKKMPTQGPSPAPDTKQLRGELDDLTGPTLNQPRPPQPSPDIHLDDL